MLRISYALGGKGKKSITFTDDRIDIDIVHKDKFTEHLPFLLNAGDSLTIPKTGEAELKKQGCTVHIFFDDKANPEIKETSFKSGTQRVVVLTISANGQLKYSIIPK
jgi:hypothetical protein